MTALLRVLSFVLIAALAVATSPLADAQSALLQGGPITPGHMPMYIGGYSQQPIVTDGGGASGGPPGTGLSELGLTVRGNGTPPFANAGTGNLGTNFCDYDAPITNATGYHALCMSPNAQGGGLITYNAFGSAPQLPLTIQVNGQNFNFPGSTNCIGCGTLATQDAANVSIGKLAATVAPTGVLTTPSGLAYTPLGTYVTSTSDNASGGTSGVSSPTLLYSQQYFGGPNINSGRNNIAAFSQFTAPTAVSNPYRFYVGISSYYSVLSSDNGTSGTPAGDFEAGTDQIQLSAGATNLFAEIGHEIDMSAVTGSSVYDKAALTLSEFANDAVHGSNIDAWIWTYGFTGGIGMNTWAEIDAAGGTPALPAGGTLINVASIPTLANGILFGEANITGAVLQWTSTNPAQTFALDGNGNAFLDTVHADGLSVAGAGGIFITGAIATGTPATYACFTSGQELISSSTPC